MSEHLQTAARHHREGNVALAERLYREYLGEHPGDPRVLWALAHACYQQRNLADSIACLEQAIAVEPVNAEFHFTLANLLVEAGADPARALSGYRKAISLNPDHGAAWLNLGVMHYHHRQYAAAIDALSKAASLGPQHEEKALHNLGLSLMRAGRAAEADRMYRRACEIAPDNPAIHTSLLFNLHNVPGLTNQEIYDEHLRWAARFAATPDVHDDQGLPARIRKDDAIRVGYLSPDFRRHSVSYFIGPIFRAHDRAAVTCYGYSDVEHPDDVTRRLMGTVDHWRDISGMDDEQLFHLIRQDGIDILVDLAGHTYRNRLRLFSRKPATVQISYLGYPGTTGLHAMDYRLTDLCADPDGESDRFHTEELVRIENGFLCYEPPTALPVSDWPPVMNNGFVTFGSFNNLAKLNDEVIGTWCEILQRVPGARLLLKAPGLGDSAGRTTVLSGCLRHGVGEDRIECLGRMDEMDQHLGTYHRVDIALDTFPYNGTTTTCEALWMGVPVVTLAGDRHASRVGASILTTVGLAGLVATRRADYVDFAVRLARDKTELERVRTGMRDRLRHSRLMDAAGFCRVLESHFRRMFERIS